MPEELRRNDLARFYEEVGKHYNEEEVVYRDLRGILRKRFVLQFIKESFGNFLDLGCNNGIYTEHFNGTFTVGVDLSHSVLTQAQIRCKKAKNLQNQIFIKGNIENLNFMKNVRFDFILCSEVLEHLFHPIEVFHGISNFLKPGGKALITTPNYKKHKPTWIKLGELKFSVSGEEYFHTAYRPEELVEFAQTAKLKVQEFGTLEWEVKYAAKIPALFFIVFRFLNRCLFRSAKFDRINQRFFEYFTLLCYTIFHSTGIERLFKRFIKEGVRSFVVLTK